MPSTRTTCSTCGLPHYGTATDDCPYCTRAGGTSGTGAVSEAETTHRLRDACESCALPYYTDENESCPYCGRVSGEPIAEPDAGESSSDWESPRPEAGSSRLRESCVACGLPYYVDDNDDCPYCGHDQSTATPDEPTADAESTEPADSTTETVDETAVHAETSETAESAADESESPGVLTRLRRAIGL